MEQTFRFSSHPDQSLTALLFTDVQNAKELQEQVVSGTIPVDCSFINASLVPDLFLLQLAASKSLEAQKHGGLKTRSLHAELVFSLSGTRQITDSLKRFGVSDGISAVLVARFNATADELVRIRDAVKGTETPLDKLPSLTDAAQLKKVLKITPQELQIGSLADAVACRMAARDC